MQVIWTQGDVQHFSYLTPPPPKKNLKKQPVLYTPLCLHEDHCEFTLSAAGGMAVVDLYTLELCQVVFTMGKFNR